MKKDFSQNFKVGKLHAYFIIRDSVSKKYLLYTSNEEYEEEFCNTLNIDLEIDISISRQIAAFLYENNLVLNSFRELARECRVSFSFSDDTPGTESSIVCFIVDVDVINPNELNHEHENASFVDIYDLLDKLSSSPYFSLTANLGIAQLISEDKILNR